MKKILVVDDDPDLLGAICLALTRAGYATVPAGDGKEALERLAEGGIGLVVSDIVMPGMDGLELIAEVRRRFAGVPMIAMSGGGRLPTEFHLRYAASSGACRVLAKPFLLADLVSLVRELYGVETPAA